MLCKFVFPQDQLMGAEVIMGDILLYQFYFLTAGDIQHKRERKRSLSNKNILYLE